MYRLCVEHGVVVLHFGTPVVWVGLPPESARQLAAKLNEIADAAERDPRGVA